MTAILVVCLLGCTVWVLAVRRRRDRNDPRQSVEGFRRVPAALQPDSQRPRRR